MENCSQPFETDSEPRWSSWITIGTASRTFFLLAAVVENGRVRDLLLRNDGDGHFTDVTAEVGLAGVRASLGCCVGDFDNNEFSDLFVTRNRQAVVISQQW
jgi:VCBS repeat protein